MEQLISQVSTKYNLSEADATGIVDKVKNYMAANTAEETTTQPAAATAQASVVQGEVKEEGMLEKAEHFITDHLPGGLKEKAEEMLGGVGNKIKGLFS
ncbi:MAG: hypothetical protein ACKVOW_17705 [Chitinophagaceae bacterium]